METLIFHFMYIIHDLQWIHIILWRTDLYVLNVNLYWKWLSTSVRIGQYMSYARPWQCSNKNYFWSFGKRHWNWKYVFRHKLNRHEQFYLLFYRSDSFDKNLGQTCIFYSQNTGITRMDALAEFNIHVERLSVVCSE